MLFERDGRGRQERDILIENETDGEGIVEEVIIKKCNSYDYKEVETAVFSSMDYCPALKTKEKKTGKALIKVNLLKKNMPEDAVTTHPAVVEAAVRYLQNLGWNVIIGDSPGGPFYKKRLEEIYNASGMAKVAEATGCELNYDITSVEVKNEKAEKLKAMKIIRVVTKVDLIVSIAKFKTHCMMSYTGGVKNLFGVIPGLTKAEYHFKMHTAENFADHLVDICEYVRPDFIKKSLVSGIVPRKVEEFFIKSLRPKPIFHHEKCISCGDCLRGCPAKIIKMKNGKPVANLEKCISCFCCHELCPEKAIEIKVHWLHKILFGNKG